MLKAKELDINGTRLKSGQMTSQIKRFFESQGTTIEDKDGEVTLSGTFILQGHPQKPHFESHNEEPLALEIISPGF